MDFETLVRRFSILFSFCGVSPFGTTTKRAQKWKIFFAEMFPVILYLGVLIAMLITATCSRYRNVTYYGSVSGMVSYTQFCAEILVQFAFIGQAIVFRENLKKMFRAYDFVQKYMKTRMGHNIEFEAFRNRLYQLIASIFLPHLTTMILRRLLLQKELVSIFNTILALSYFMSSLVQLHLIIHVELLKFFLLLLTKWLRKEASEFSAKSLYAQKDFIKYQQLNGYKKTLQLKLIHFKLWELSVNFNRIFGWSLVAIILRNSMEIAYKAYWVFMYSSRMAHFTITLRKYTAAIYSKSILYFPELNSAHDFIGPALLCLTSIISTVVLINASHYCSIQVPNRKFRIISKK